MWYDARPPGKLWNPKYVRRVSLDNSGNSPAPSSNDTASNGGSDASKSLWYDARPPGMPWKPKYMRRSSAPVRRVATKSSEESWIPQGERKANKELCKEVTRIFEEAAKRGKNG